MPRKLRVKGAVACESMLRLMRFVTDAGDGDVEGYMVYLAVVAAGISRFLRDPGYREAHADEPIPDELRAPVSRRAIAASVGLPRETVRRKIAAMIEAGDLMERDGGVIAVGPVLERRNNLHFIRQVLRELDRVSAELDRIDAA